ncbi:MAG: aminodeoxychorismate/anthranilate synthase component II [Waddliaceae bacterium]|nr:aminodeoxychorismate/anthranilate synthase component II [Waddliaceae bacterium]
MILLIDNYDSFTYNLYQYLACFHENVQVVRNDEITIEEVKALQPQAIVLSPGPGRPEDAGIIVELIRRFSKTIPVLGICLGFQAIAMAFDASVVPAGQIVHGKSVPVFHTRKGLFKAMSLPFSAGRYHSLMVSRDGLESLFEIEAETIDGTVMAAKHKEYPCYGLQFHPESILTPEGEKLIQSFLELEVA